MKLIKAKKGVTLIELIVAVTIFTIILVAIFSFFSFGNNTFVSGDSRFDIQKSLRTAVSYITEQVRYSTDLEIQSSGTVPSQSSIPQYVNYMYYDSTNNAIIHINKYFIKTIPIVNTSGTNTGSISFKSVDPYKSINFNIYAKNKKQEYNIEGKLNPLNLELGASTTVVGIVDPAATPPAKTGPVLKFKTANNYMSQILMPVAQIGTTNETKKFTVDFDRNILSVELITTQTTGVTNPTVSFSGQTVTVNTTNTTDGANVAVRVTFSDYEAYGNIYDYTAQYDSVTKWDIL